MAPAAKTGPKPKDESGVQVSRTECGKLFASERQAQQLRAIAERAPEPVRELYRGGLIGAKEAAALGPKNPSPEEAARVTAIAIEAKSIAAAEKPRTEREKRTLQRKVNETVRARLGREADPIRDAARAFAKVPTHKLAGVVEGLPGDTARLLLLCLRDRVKEDRGPNDVYATAEAVANIPPDRFPDFVSHLPMQTLRLLLTCISQRLEASR